jgi:GT2 family glycosyltransferase
VHHNTRIFSFPENQEYSGSVNAILSHARGDFICFVSNDIFVTRNYFELLLAVAREEEGVGIVRGSSNFVDNGLPSHNLAPIHEIHSLEDVFREGEDVATLFGTISVPDPYLTGDAFLATRALLQSIGSFDPLFYGYFADHDFGLRSKIAGFRNLLVPGAFAYHSQGANFSYLSEQERARKLNRRWARVYENWARFKLKYGLPVSLLYTNINDVPWQQLEQESLGKEQYFSPPGDYLGYLTYPRPVVNL